MITPISNSDSWQKASILGSVWGAFEIVAGSIMHNLAIPMAAGTILSVLGVIIMVSGARVFGGKGIFWRSALVCAALKTVSPSPVILSPMIGITLEGFLMEAGVQFLGQNLVGYMIGGGLAVLSILGFKLVRLIMIYGTDVVTAYKSIFNIAFSNGLINEKGFLLPLAIFVVIYLAIGAFAAYSGYYGGNAIKKRFKASNIKLLPLGNQYKPNMVKGYKGGIGFLLFHIVWLIVFIAFKGFVPFIYWLSGGIIYLSLCLFRYGRVRSLLLRPTFWIAIILVSTTSSVFILIGKYDKFVFNLEFFEYNFTILIRAVVVIIAFACISIELRSKGVSRHFGKGVFAPLAKSYVHAHDALPSLLSTFKEKNNKFYRPLPIIERMFTHFTNHNKIRLGNNSVFIISADKQGGKTTFMQEMVVYFEKNNIPVAGFIAEGIWDKNQHRSGFNLLNLQNYCSIPLCDKTSNDWLQFGSFFFNPKAIEAGKEILNNAPIGSIVFIDEIGLFELEDSLWSVAFSKILNQKNNPIIVSIRRTFLEQAIVKWKMEGATIIDATSDCPEEIAKQIIEPIKFKA